MKTITLALIFVTVVFPIYGQELCSCKKAKSSDTTIYGGNMWNVWAEEGTFKLISGTVADMSGVGLNGALVEVFDKPEYLECEYLPDNPNRCTTNPPKDQRRIAACITGADGSFCFPKLRSGKYELRISRSAGWNVEHRIVDVQPKGPNAKNGGLEILMTVGG